MGAGLMKTTTEMQLVPITKLVPYVNNARTHSSAGHHDEDEYERGQCRQEFPYCFHDFFSLLVSMFVSLSDLFVPDSRFFPHN